MRGIAIGFLGIAVLFGGFALRDLVRTSPEPRAWARYSDQDFGWSLTYPARFELRPFSVQSRVTENGFVVSNVVLPAGPVVRTSSLPPTAVAFRLVHTVGGALLLPPAGPGTRFPLSKTLFEPENKRQRRRFRAVANGVAFWGDVWVGPEASRTDRKTLARIVRSLRFSPTPMAASAP